MVVNKIFAVTKNQKNTEKVTTLNQECRVQICALFTRDSPAITFVAAIFITLAFACSAAAQTVPKVNDTGVEQCYDNTTAVTCASVATDTGTHPRQDARHGRDAKNTAGTLAKVGTGSKAFDYTKVCNSGDLAGTGTCSANPSLGTTASDWACTKDNVTGLVWEIKTAINTDLRFSGHNYTWYSANTATNGGVAGYTGSNTCNATLPSSLCNTDAYVTAVNAETLCGSSDWRLPNLLELQSLIDYAKTGVSSPTVDTALFPGTVANAFYWSNTTRSFSIGLAYTVGTAATVVFPDNKTNSPNAGLHSVRLVRGGL